MLVGTEADVAKDVEAMAVVPVVTTGEIVAVVDVVRMADVVVVLDEKTVDEDIALLGVIICPVTSSMNTPSPSSQHDVWFPPPQQ